MLKKGFGRVHSAKEPTKTEIAPWDEEGELGKAQLQKDNQALPLLLRLCWQQITELQEYWTTRCGNSCVLI